MKRLLVLLLVLVQVARPGTTGKIAGRIVDASTRQPLPSVNVLIVGTTTGATTDSDGNYFLLNVPVGTYTIRASMVGYAAEVVENVKVMADLTTTIDIALQATDIQMRDVVVVAERPAIQPDRTSSRHTVDQEMINALPVDDFREVVQMQAGVVGSHFRGGRFNEALFLVDGIQVKSAVNGYTGYTGGMSLNLPEIGISEIQVSTGGFEAEYGNAQSGVVNTITRESATLGAKLRARTSMIPGQDFHYNPNDYATGQSDWRDYEGYINSPTFQAGDLRLAMLGSAEVSFQTRDYLPHQDFDRQSYQGKLLMSTGGSRMTVNGLYSYSRANSYYHRYSKYGPLSEGYQSDLYQQLTTIGGVPTLQQYIFVSDPGKYRHIAYGDSALYNGTWYRASTDTANPFQIMNIYQAGMQRHISLPINRSYNIGLAFTQTLNNQSYLDIKLSQFWTNFHEVVQNVDNRDGSGNTSSYLNWQLNGGIGGYQDRQFEEGYWYYTGDEGWYLNQVSRTSSMRVDYSNQVNTKNLLKGGVEFSYNQGDVEKVTFESVNNQRFDVWKNELVDFAAYVQDKVEVRDGFILNAGIRFDYFNPNGFGPTVYYPANPEDLANPARRSTMTASDAIVSHWQISPRIGISHPITERDKIHFTYGHFFQRPDLRYLFENTDNLVRAFQYTTNVDIGNPRLLPEKTVSYEVGWEHLFADYFRLDVTGYFKDITNLVAQKDIDLAGSASPFQIYTNVDYANVRGLEFTFETVGMREFSGMVNYTFAYANGRSSSVARSNGEIVPRRLDPLDWDVRHKINANLLFRSTGAIADLIGDAQVNFVVSVQSGLPYTTNTRDLFPLFALRNDGRLPWRKNVDMRFRKTFGLRPVEISLLAEVRNLFNWRNVDYISGGREGIIQFEQTGDPTGPYHDPAAWSPPRVIRFGIEVQL